MPARFFITDKFTGWGLLEGGPFRIPDAPMTCLRCDDCDWFCEVHFERPWLGEHACKCGAAGAPCPICNPSDQDNPPELPKGFRTSVDKKGDRH